MKVTITGAGALAREIYFVATAVDYQVVGFLCSDREREAVVIDGTSVLGSPGEWPQLPSLLAIGDSKIRRALGPGIRKRLTLLAPTAVNRDSANEIGEGCIICDGVILTTNIKMGEFCLVNIGCLVGHDVSIGDYTTLCPGVKLMGRCRVGADCFLGTGAVVLPDVELPAHGTIGAGAVVVSAPPGLDGATSYTMTGCPAKLTKVSGIRL